MVLVTLKQILQKAHKRKYAVGAFNTSNYETTQAIINAAVTQRSPVIIQTTESAIAYAGMDMLLNIIKTLGKQVKVPVAVHLDHGKHPAIVRKGIQHGYTSVMIDASRYPLGQNIRITMGVVRAAHKKGVSVEAELGRILGTEDTVTSKEELFTDPEEAKLFVKKTRCDALAVAIGTAHGIVKAKGKPHLAFARLQEIKHTVNMPLVLHGASHIDQEMVKLANKFGAKLRHTQGIPDSQIKRAVKLGINKVNIDSDLRIAFDASVRQFLKKNPRVYDPRKILGATTTAVQKTIEQKMKLLGSAGKA